MEISPRAGINNKNDDNTQQLMSHLPSTAKELMNYFNDVIESKESGIVFRNADIEYILTYHPNYQEKELAFLSNMVVVHSNKSRLKKSRLYILLVTNLDGIVCTEDYISLNRCIHNAVTTIDEESVRMIHVVLAFYNTIRGYPIGFGRVFQDICDICKDMKNVFIHCKRPNETFETVVIKFLKESTTIINLMAIGIIITRAGIILRDIELINQWLAYCKEKRSELWVFICYRCYNNNACSSSSTAVIETKCDSELDKEIIEDDAMVTSPHVSARSNHREVSIIITKASRDESSSSSSSNDDVVSNIKDIAHDNISLISNNL